MKKIMLMCAMLLAGSMASAANGPLWACDLNANLQGYEAGLGLSVKKLAGPGVISCVALDGSEQVQVPVNVEIKGYGAGLGWSRTNAIKMVGVGMGAVSNPQSLAHNYKLGVSAGAALVRAGIGFDAAFSTSRQGGGLEIGLIGKDVQGLSLAVHLQKMSITLR
ncbi:MAG: hypothetical protein AB7O96_02620 [Pseudobdellovibrionaceae bacterium]